MKAFMAGLHLNSLSTRAANSLPSKALVKNFPADVQERLAPRLDNLPVSRKRIFGIVILILLVAVMFGLVVWGGVDGIHNGYNFWDFLTRFLIMFGGLKAFDIIGLDFILLTKTQFFARFLIILYAYKAYDMICFDFLLMTRTHLGVIAI